jgi:hypothetical protein
MALGDTFAQQFQVGDVVYGASQARAPYINSLPPLLKTACENGGMWLICDNFNNRTFNRAAVVGAGGLYPTSKTNIQTNLALNDADANINVQQQAQLRAYYDALSASSRRPTKAVKLKLAEVQAKGNQDHADLAFRRACKFGLEYFLMVLQVKVHFALDMPAFYGVGPYQNSQDVVDKTQHAGHVPITTSELRCCYRNKDEWMPTGRLKFYKNLQEVDPPWVSDFVVWAQYGIDRYKKHHPILTTISRCFI